MTSVIVDLDVLADSRWRDDLRDGGDWDAYHAAGANDPLDTRALMIVNGLARMGCYIEVVTHRPARWSTVVSNWLFRFDVCANRISSRPDHSFAANHDVIASLIGAIPRPDFVLLPDTDERLIEAVRATGVFIVQVSRP